MAKRETSYEAWLREEGIPIIEGTAWKTLLNCRESPGREQAGRVLIFSSQEWKDSPACMSVKSPPARP